MPDSITREELMREVADRLDADPGLVARRVATRGKGGGGKRPPRPADDGADPGSGAGARPGGQRALNARERRERALLAMCDRAAGGGREFLERLTAEHLTSPRVRGRGHGCVGHLEDPREGLPRDDEELVAYVIAGW